MTRRDLTRLFVRVFGLFILVSAVVWLPLSTERFIVELSALEAGYFVYTWQTVALRGASHFGPFVTYAAVGLCCLWWSGRIVDRVSIAPDQGEVVESTDLRNIEISLVAVLGLYFLADGFAELCRWSISQILSYPVSGPITRDWLSIMRNWLLIWDIPFIVQALVELIIGILLVLGRGGTVAVRRRIHAWVRKLRTWPD